MLRAPTGFFRVLIGTQMKLMSRRSRFLRRALLRNVGSLLARGTMTGLPLSSTRPVTPSPIAYRAERPSGVSPSEASTWSSPESGFNRVMELHTTLSRRSSSCRTRWSDARRLEPPASASLTLASAINRAASLEITRSFAIGIGVSVLLLRRSRDANLLLPSDYQRAAARRT